ncbi:class I SAM-dependent methyltransferase [Actinoplanes sp. NPDC049265]|uniref:class I SAM-dependent methyltransferase n=1 Tax=Actinoplanes sp. NPDC049265 TaxID=3363902 RepID=UPI003716B90D
MTSHERVSDEQLAEQLSYYSRRAGEYNDWWLRRGAFDQGESENAVWFHESGVALDALAALDLGDDVLELAPGTGNWSVHLAPRATRLTLVDGSVEMLAHNPAAGQPHVRTEIADLFTWDSAERFDSVVFAFWISHVPRERLASFFARVGSWLRPGGAVFFVDDLPRAVTSPHVAGVAGQTMTRRLNSGDTATIVKNFFTAGELTGAAAAAGITMSVHETGRLFQYGATVTAAGRGAG